MGRIGWNGARSATLTSSMWGIIGGLAPSSSAPFSNRVPISDVFISRLESAPRRRCGMSSERSTIVERGRARRRLGLEGRRTGWDHLGADLRSTRLGAPVGRLVGMVRRRGSRRWRRIRIVRVFVHVLFRGDPAWTNARVHRGPLHVIGPLSGSGRGARPSACSPWVRRRFQASVSSKGRLSV